VLFIPLPFVVTILLAMLLWQLLRKREAGNRTDQFFIVLISIYMVQSVLLGLRWGYEITAALPLQILLASLIAGLAYLSFYSLTVPDSTQALSLKKIWPHLLPVTVIFSLLLFRRDLAALAIIVIFLVYGVSLLWLTYKGPDIFDCSKTGWCAAFLSGNADYRPDADRFCDR
jgi:hypothetical protein